MSFLFSFSLIAAALSNYRYVPSEALVVSPTVVLFYQHNALNEGLLAYGSTDSCLEVAVMRCSPLNRTEEKVS